MHYKRINLSLILLFTVFTYQQAQTAITASGGNATGSGGSASYSIGQVGYTYSAGSAASITQGVQQTFIIETSTETKDMKGINLICSAYPNPVADWLILKIEDFKNEDLLCQLLNANGQILKTLEIKEIETQIPMRELSSATYYLKVTDDTNRDIKTFKIIKN